MRPVAPVRSDASLHVVLVLVQIAFGSLAVEGKLAMSPAYGVSPRALAMSRILGGAVAFASVSAARRARGGASPKAVRSVRDVAELAALALFGIVLNQALFLAGLRKTSPVSATLLVATIPVFIAIVAAVSGRDRLTPRGLAGVALAILGIAAITGFALPASGDLLVLLNSLSYAVYVVFAKGPLARHGTATVVAWVFGLGAVLFAPFGGPALIREAPGWSAGAIGLVAFVVLVPTVFAYGLNAWALRRATPTLVAVYVYLQPLVVTALAWAQLGPRVERPTVGGGLLVLAGVTVVATGKKAVTVVPVPPAA